MKKEYTAAQLKDAEKVTRVLANIQPEKKNMVVVITNAFIAGMEAQKALDETAKV